ncbi:MAG: caspase family protein, partial [Bacteroidaceae bacterium]|nr:caspase family protein [Bacteroidaceae bacterium]
MERFVEELGVIEAAVDCEEDWHVYIGDDCTKPNLEKVLSDMRCSSNDVVFFYYSGHGVHAKADPADGWLPQMCLNYRSYNQDKFVPVTYVREQLKSKGARLNIIMTDCCNNEAEWVTVKGMLLQQKGIPQTDKMDVAKLKKLFLDSKGTIIATSSKRGQVSLGTK